MFTAEDLDNFEYLSDFKIFRIDYMIRYSISTDGDEKVLLRKKLANALRDIKALWDLVSEVKLAQVVLSDSALAIKASTKPPPL